MAIDPICGMTVNEASALSAERNGQTYWFCCDQCRQKFLSTPANVIPVTGPFGGGAPAHAESPVIDRICTCPMHAEVQQKQPGKCPKCGMALELKTQVAGAQ